MKKILLAAEDSGFKTKELANYIKSTVRTDNPIYKCIQEEIVEQISKSLVFGNTIARILDARSDTTPPHILSIIVQGIIYTAYYKYTKEQIDKFKQEGWRTFVKLVSTTPKLLTKFFDYTAKENSHVFILNRYSAFKLACQMFFKNKPIDVLDVGASINVGFPALERGMVFNNLDRGVIERLSRNVLEVKLNFARSLSVDIKDENTALDSSLKVGSALMSTNELRIIKDLLNSTKNSRNKFIRTDILLFLKNNVQKFDATFASNVLYQLNPLVRSQFFVDINNALKEGGILIVNDYLKETNLIEWVDDWSYGGRVNYRTIIYLKKGGNLTQYNYLSWDSSKCNLAVKSKDFDTILKLT